MILVYFDSFARGENARGEGGWEELRSGGPGPARRRRRWGVAGAYRAGQHGAVVAQVGGQVAGPAQGAGRWLAVSRASQAGDDLLGRVAQPGLDAGQGDGGAGGVDRVDADLAAAGHRCSSPTCRGVVPAASS